MSNGISRETYKEFDTDKRTLILFDLQCDTKKDTSEILKVLKNPETGLCVRTKLTEASISRVYKWVAAVGMTIFLWAIKGSIG